MENKYSSETNFNLFTSVESQTALSFSKHIHFYQMSIDFLCKNMHTLNLPEDVKPIIEFGNKLSLIDANKTFLDKSEFWKSNLFNTDYTLYNLKHLNTHNKTNNLTIDYFLAIIQVSGIFHSLFTNLQHVKDFLPFEITAQHLTASKQKYPREILPFRIETTNIASKTLSKIKGIFLNNTQSKKLFSEDFAIKKNEENLVHLHELLKIISKTKEKYKKDSSTKITYFNVSSHNTLKLTEKDFLKKYNATIDYMKSYIKEFEKHIKLSDLHSFSDYLSQQSKNNPKFSSQHIFNCFSQFHYELSSISPTFIKSVKKSISIAGGYYDIFHFLDNKNTEIFISNVLVPFAESLNYRLEQNSTVPFHEKASFSFNINDFIDFLSTSGKNKETIREEIIQNTKNYIDFINSANSKNEINDRPHIRELNKYIREHQLILMLNKTNPSALSRSYHKPKI